MKRILHILYAGTLCSLISGCNFLNVEHVGKSDIEGFFSEVAAAKAAVYGVHSLLYSLEDSYIIPYATVSGDEIVLNTSEATWNNYQNFAQTSDDDAGPLAMIWKNGYMVINNCNQITEHIPGLKAKFPNSTDELDGYMAQALFVRALMHFQMCQAFGQNYSFTPDASHLGMAIVTRPLGLSEKPSRNTVAEVYGQVIKDLEESLRYYPEGFAFSRNLPSPLSSQALLARVYLNKGDWAKAAEYAGKVIDQIQLTPRSEYATMFTGMQEPAKDEMIYTLSGLKSNKTGQNYKLYWQKEPKARPSSRVYNLIPEGDIRKDVTEYEGNYACMKFNIPDGAADPFSNIPILRVSEMYLIRAEALNESGKTDKAAADIEALQSRAMGIEVKLPDMSKEQMALLIEEERIKELCFEGQRLWDITRRHKDLVRTDDSSATVKEIKYPDYRFVLPIPAVELESNDNMKNNPTSNE